MRMGYTEVGVTELIAVTEHASGISKLALGILLAPDVVQPPPSGRSSLVGLPTDDELDPDVRTLLAEIGAREQERLGLDRLPNVWRLLALDPHYLKAAWQKHEFALRAGQLDGFSKLAAALAVAMSVGCRYFIEYFSLAFRRAGASPRQVLQVAAIVDHFNSFNTLADGMAIESDIYPLAHGQLKAGEEGPSPT